MMRTLLTLVVLAAGACRSAPLAPVHLAGATPDPELLSLARELGEAALRGDRAEVSRHMLSFTDAANLSTHTRKLGERRWNDAVDDFFRLSRDEGHHAHVVDASIVATGTLTSAKDEVTGDLDYAFVQIVFERDIVDGATVSRQRESLRAFAFLRTSAGWRLSPHP